MLCVQGQNVPTTRQQRRLFNTRGKKKSYGLGSRARKEENFCVLFSPKRFYIDCRLLVWVYGTSKHQHFWRVISAPVCLIILWKHGEKVTAHRTQKLRKIFHSRVGGWQRSFYRGTRGKRMKSEVIPVNEKENYDSGKSLSLKGAQKGLLLRRGDARTWPWHVSWECVGAILWNRKYHKLNCFSYQLNHHINKFRQELS